MEELMGDRGLRAPLSPKEEAALQQVAMANPDAEKLQDPYVRRLKDLSLIEERAGRLELTETGVQRHGGPPRRKRMKKRQLPF
jgi:hypothetical protein